MAPPKNVDGEGKGKGKAIANTSTRVLRSMGRKTRSDTQREGSSSKLVKLESPEKKKRKTTKAKNGGAAKKKVKKEEVAVKIEKEDEESAEEEDGDAAEKEEEDEDDDDDSEKKIKIVIEHCKQCKSFRERANEVKEGLEEAVPGIVVTVNPDKPRRGCFEIREEGGETFISLLAMKRPFTPMKELNMEEVITDIVEKIK